MAGKAVAASTGAASTGATSTASAESQNDAPGYADAAEAVRALFRDHHLELVRLAVMMLGDIPAAEDVVQDAFEQIHRHWRRIREPSSGLAYARSCVLNGCRSAHRRAAVARKYSPWLAQHPDAPAADQVAGVDDSDQIMAALRVLTRRQREAIVLRYYADLDVAEIAKTLRVSPGAVRATINRALATLASALGEERTR
ncbi:MAG TPA: SigE family RNA polymerase sigma factor [Streptosporangiaceae bacterium]|nr:SigE family RNA polymerase sigma factor [Streptosporangiaceae bacterium]